MRTLMFLLPYAMVCEIEGDLNSSFWSGIVFTIEPKNPDGPVLLNRDSGLL
jgi:hypothetical protein